MTRARILQRISTQQRTARPALFRALAGTLRAVFPAPAANARPTTRKRIAVLFAAIAVPALAAGGPAPGEFGGIAGNAPGGEALSRMALHDGAMPFEKPGMSFPGSAFYYLADPPARAALIALPETDPLGAGLSRAPGKALDAGPAATPFLAAGGNALAEKCLAEAIWYEAASESEAGQRAVAQVVLNRVRHPAWPNSVCGVVYQGSQRTTGCQFTFTCDGSLARKAAGASWARARRIAGEALAGEVYAPVGLATHYHTLWVAPRWAGSLDHIGTIGAHRFYRARGNAGSLAAFDAAYAGIEPVSREGWTAPVPAPVAGGGRRPAPAVTAPVPTAALAPSPSPADTRAPVEGSGSVRAEFRDAGRWKARPEERAAPRPRIAPQALDPAAE